MTWFMWYILGSMITSTIMWRGGAASGDTRVQIFWWIMVSWIAWPIIWFMAFIGMMRYMMRYKR